MAHEWREKGAINSSEMKVMIGEIASCRKVVAVACAIVSLVYSVQSACPYASSGTATAGRSGRSTRSGTVSCGGCRTDWIPSDKPELNPPEDIATLPELEQRKFRKAFSLVPKEVKVKSTQKYSGRMTFMKRDTYAGIRKSLAEKLNRSKRMLEKDPPVITADYVLKMCDDTIIYGRSLVMGEIKSCDLPTLARRYGFDKAANEIERLESRRNFQNGLASGYSHDDPECRDFETLAKKVNGAQWQAFLDRVKMLRAKHDGRNGGGISPTREEVYGPDQRSGVPSGMLPADFATLPNRENVRYGKIYGLLPPQVVSVSGEDYRKRQMFMHGPVYKALREKLDRRLAKEGRRLEEYPAVTAKEVLVVCEELVRYGRPLAHGELRHVSLRDLARTYKFEQVRDFMEEFERVESNKSLKRGFSRAYSSKDPEWADFATLAGRVKKDDWKAFKSRLEHLNRLAVQKAGETRRR